MWDYSTISSNVGLFNNLLLHTLVSLSPSPCIDPTEQAHGPSGIRAPQAPTVYRPHRTGPRSIRYTGPAGTHGPLDLHTLCPSGQRC
uniref:DUF1263 domain-containing protein n=1 Tax=Oryza meridionalis TaxID=40149 RepID=A0A0E0EVN0_9ORYZ